MSLNRCRDGPTCGFAESGSAQRFPYGVRVRFPRRTLTPPKFGCEWKGEIMKVWATLNPNHPLQSLNDWEEPEEYATLGDAKAAFLSLYNNGDSTVSQECSALVYFNEKPEYGAEADERWSLRIDEKTWRATSVIHEKH